MKILVIMMIAVLALLSCSQKGVKSQKNESGVEVPEAANLTRDFADYRRDQIKSVDYNLSFAFLKGSKKFYGTSLIEVELNHLDNPLVLDTEITDIKSLSVNKVPLRDYKLGNSRIIIPTKHLRPKLSIQIAYSQTFHDKNRGMQKFTDKVDKTEYIFTDNEPYDANQFFPTFDQPDLKARYTVNIETPTDWKAISNAPSTHVVQKKNSKVTYFKRTKPFSTYLLFIGAGNYAELKDQYKNIPLSLYVRQSLLKHLDHKNIFDVTKKGLKFYNQYFGYPYPFEKYDHVFAPGLAPGAMENPGAVTMNERMIYRGPVPITTKARRANTILHEMVHMWFGDLVTMKWWNDLWLNESFATYLASIGSERALKYPYTWQSFNDSKGWAYWQDQLVTTHPIETDPKVDAKDAMANFDGITYAKGASSLKQLHFYVGEEAFERGLKYYFKTYAWKNTTRAQFIDAIARHSSEDLSFWTSQWLQKAGLQAIYPQWECKEGKISQFEMIQEPSQTGHLSPHKTQLAFFKLIKGHYQMEHVLRVSFKKEKNRISGALGKPCPDLVFTNYRDHDYGLFYLDKKSFSHLEKNFSKLKDNFTKQQLWRVAYNMVYNSRLPVDDYLELLTNYFHHVEDAGLLKSVIGRWGGARTAFSGFLSPKKRSEWAPKIETMVARALKKHARGSDEQLLWLDFYLSMAHTEKALVKLTSWLNSSEYKKLTGQDLDIERRWKIIKKLATKKRLDHKKIDAYLEQERTDQTEMFALQAKVAIPTKANKSWAWNVLTGQKSDISWNHRKRSMAFFHNFDSPQLTFNYKEKFFRLVEELDKSKNNAWHIERYFSLFPEKVSEDFLEESEDLLNDRRAELQNISRRAWLEANDGLRRRLNIFKFNSDI